jgi:hypothetical protein
MPFVKSDWPQPVPEYMRRDVVTVLKLVVAEIDEPTKALLRGGHRTRATRIARSVSAYLLAKWCGLDTKQIGPHVSNADRNAVCKWLLKMRRENPDGLTGTRWERIEHELEAM